MTFFFNPSFYIVFAYISIFGLCPPYQILTSPYEIKKPKSQNFEQFCPTLHFIWKSHSFQFLAMPSLLEYDKPLYFFFGSFLGFRPPPAKSKSTAKNIWISHMIAGVHLDLAGGRVGPRHKRSSHVSLKKYDMKNMIRYGMYDRIWK